MSSTADLVMLARVSGSLIVVLVVVALAARMARRGQRLRSTTGMRVVERTGLSRDASVAVVEVADKALVLGVTAHGVSVLTVLDSEATRTERDRSTQERTGQTGRQRAGAERPAADPGPVNPDDFGRLVERAEQRLFGPTPTVNLAGHPDLASALRAAGRVQDARPAPQVPRQPTRSDRRPSRPAAAPPPRGAGRRAAKQTRTARSTDGRPASGSVLDPATWRQGLEALRDLTARKG